MKLLITGSGGQVGTELRRLPWPQGYSLVGFDMAGLDITRRDQVSQTVAREKPDLVVNAAAYTAVDRAESEPAAAWDRAALCAGEPLLLGRAGRVARAAFSDPACRAGKVGAGRARRDL